MYVLLILERTCTSPQTRKAFSYYVTSIPPCLLATSEIRSEQLCLASDISMAMGKGEKRGVRKQEK